MRARMALTVAVVYSSVVANAREPAPWPQFRGPAGSGIADEEKPPIEIGPEKNVKWKVPTPDGLSSPIIVGDRLVCTAYDDGKLYTIAYSRADGHELWRANAPAKEIEPYFHGQGSPAASTPVTDGERIVSYFGSCGLFCYDLDGTELWKYELPTAVTMGDFGTGTSPVMADGTVVLVRDVTNEPKILALDVASHELLWEKKRVSRSSFCTPAVWNTPTGKQIAAPGFSKLIGYDLRTGDEKWFVDGMPSACCASPVTSEGNLLFAAWSPGDPSEKDSFKLPSYDDILKEGDANGDGVLSKDEAEKSAIGDFFNSMDADRDGRYTRSESEQVERYISATVNSAFALKPGGSGDITKSHVVWKQKRGLPYVPSAIAYRGQFIMVKDGGMLTAYDVKTGEVLYDRKRAVDAGKYYASPVAANGHIYFTSLEDGTVTVLKAGSTPPQVVVKNPPLEERTAATPAIADDTMYIRTAGHLYAFADPE
jgi:outer membrane protein assembly factor BamB